MSYPPLTRDEIVALTCMQAGAPPEERYIVWLGELFAIYERLRAQRKRPIDPADMSEADAEAHWRGFGDNCESIEARLQHDATHLNCPACGGSGHVDDRAARPTQPGWYVVLPPDFDTPKVRAFGKDGQWWIPLGKGNGDDGWMTGREYQNWAGPIADIDAPQPFLATQGAAP